MRRTAKQSRRTRLLPALTALAAAAALSARIIQLTIAERYWVTMLVTYAPQMLLLVPNALVLLLALRHRNRRFVMINLLLLAVFCVLMLDYDVPHGSAGSQHGTRLSVMSYNIRHGDAGIERIARAIRQQKADVVCLREVRDLDGRQFLDYAISELGPGWHVCAAGDLAILSRYPAVGQMEHRVSSDPNWSVLQVVLNVKGRQVNVFNLHLSEIHPKYLMPSYGEWFPAYATSTAKRRQSQTDVLLRAIASTKGPVVVAADLNTPPRGILYRRLTSHLTDAFRVAGHGFGYTFPTWLPMLRIDYVLTRDIGIRRCYVPRSSASNHLAVVADVVLPS